MRDKAAHRRIVFPSDGGGGSATIRSKSEHVKASLRTREPKVAKARHSTALAHLEGLWDALRSGPRPLSQKQITALAGELYRAFARGGEDNPGSPKVWAEVQAFNAEVAAGRGTPLAILGIGLTPEQRRAHSMEARYGHFADGLLAYKGIVTDPKSRWALVEEVHRALTEAAAKLQRNAEGDWRPDANAARYPEWQSDHGASESPTITSIFEKWAVEARARGRTERTIKGYRSTVTTFIAFLGHDDAAKVTETDVLKWKDARLGAGVSPKTVADADLASLKSVFGWARANRKIAANPVADIKFTAGKKVLERPKGFVEGEAAAILSAAANHEPREREAGWTIAARRWVPWLCAYTGARVGEMVQLRRKDIRKEGSSWVAKITPEAGTVKNKRPRDVVIHEHLIELGFHKFVDAAEGPYLFINAKNKDEAMGRIAACKNRLQEFVRGVVPDPRVAPNHGWRHCFKTVGREVGIEDRVLDGICGQEPRSVGDAYGDVSIRAQARALAMFPRYRLIDQISTNGHANPEPT